MCDHCNCYMVAQLAAYKNRVEQPSWYANVNGYTPLAKSASAALEGMLQNAYVPPEVERLRKAQAIASEVRARRPEMQVRRIG